MFGVGTPELLIVGLLVLIVFGPKRLVSLARDLGRFVGESRREVEEFKSELASEEVHEARRAVEEVRGELGTFKKGHNDAPHRG